jgi:DNA-binding Lrp family transcriptional regulator
MSLDEIDARIVTALIRDARASYAVIGNEVGLSAPAVKRRVDRLRASGAITGFSARVDPAALGWTTEAYVELFCHGSTAPEEIGRARPHQGRGHQALRAGRGADRRRAVCAAHPQCHRAIETDRTRRLDCPA